MSCPARIDVGNRLDLPFHLFSLPRGTAKTANIAVELRTAIVYSPSRPGVLSISADSIREDHSAGVDPCKSRFPMLCSVLRHFGVSSGRLDIESQVPLSSGLGGSGVLTIAAVALMRKLQMGTCEEQDLPSLALIAHLLENGLGFSATGFQDQLAALYGGANLWTWGTHWDGPSPIYQRTPIEPSGGGRELSGHILLCFTGQSHRRGKAVRPIGMMAGADLSRWTLVAAMTQEFSDAVRATDYGAAARYLNAECDLRREIDPACLSSRARLLASAARECGAGSRYAGHGHGGCAWAIGAVDAIQTTLERWRAIARKWKGAWVVEPEVATQGLVFDDLSQGEDKQSEF